MNKGKQKTILQSVHDSASSLHQSGLIDELTMHEFDALCLPTIKKYTPTQIKRIRRTNHASQAVFAAFLNISPSTVRQWEQGVKKPNGPSLKLLNMVDQKGLQLLAANHD